MTIDLSLWHDFYREARLEPHQPVSGYLAFVEKCDERGLIPIFEERHLALLIGVPYQKLAELLKAEIGLYRTFKIRKRSGGTREISVANPLLLAIQQWVLKNILYRLPTGDHAHGGVPGRSIVSNASVHLGAKAVLRMDLTDFFGSIEQSTGTEIFRQAGYPPGLSRSLSTLCFKEDSLPQGAATSPALANLAATPLDSRLAALASGFGLSYTRYFDDLTFSGSSIGVRFIGIVSDIVSQAGFLVNEKKTILARGSSPKFVTGISVGGDRLRVPRDYRRSVKNQAFIILKRGADAYLSANRARSPLAVEVTIGRLAFWRLVEPDCQQAQELFERVSKLRPTSGLSRPIPPPTRIVPIPTPVAPN